MGRPSHIMKSTISVFGAVLVAVCLQHSLALTTLPTPSIRCPSISCRPDTICPNGRRRDNNGCPSCQCNPPECPLYKCPAIDCPNGFKKDSDGCPTCECQPSCIEVACRCPFGTIWTTDSDGCEVCSCKPEPVECPLVNCLRVDVVCPNGYKTDEKGCQICECKPLVACPLIGCLNVCPYGFAKQPNGCPSCTCNPKPTCPPPICPAIEKFCPYGIGALDENGCETCDCKPAPSCPLRKCVENCADGYVYDADGCRTCTCIRKPECSPPICPAVHNCPNGRGALDENGCETCDCKPAPSCPLRKCVENCADGYVYDANGCRTCTCKKLVQCRPLICPAVICPDGLGFESDKDENGCDINCRCRIRPQCPSFLCKFYCRLQDRFGSLFRSCRCDCNSI